MQKIVDGLTMNRHDLCNFVDVGIDIITEIDDLLLSFAKPGQRMAHFPRELGQSFLPDDAGLYRMRPRKQRVEMQLLPGARIA